ncbi:DNA-binding protein [Pasteurella multocida]|uniref:DNA-binding protein n=1 Tax=Pasteurella multocida TaxID=747 RepID=UPI002A566364|nr:DNA-binding protein [Pasteurella multocida]MDY0489456.1 DNA-binding protein [Pasteurella multocida]MDY0595987.1 DNA-binding protein [Pasteurella multocida]MDY0665409.1 DNA-binding protein [Pasteurella multocida]MDY0667515.1 DNA-binding protein [Pasteurella multocida]
MKNRTREEAKAWFKEVNITQAEWERRNGYSSNEISRVLNGKSKLNYGREREIAIKLNIALEN